MVALAPSPEAFMTLESWLGFVALWTVLSLPVGPNALTTMTATIGHGLSRGLLVAAGIALASLVHTLIAVFGVGALLLASAELFTILKLAGAVYLAWLGIQLWRNGSGASWQSAAQDATPMRFIRRGALVSLSNPKAILSYFAVIPQFVSPGHPGAQQLAVIMPTATAIVLLVYSGYAVLASPLRRWLTTAGRVRLFHRAAGSGYIAAACGLALAERR